MGRIVSGWDSSYFMTHPQSTQARRTRSTRGAATGDPAGKRVVTKLRYSSASLERDMITALDGLDSIWLLTGGDATGVSWNFMT